MADDVILINIEEGVKRVMNNTKLYAKLLTKFKEDASLKNMEAAIAAGDMEKAKVAAHTLKGVAANLSLMRLQERSLEIETQIKAGAVNPNLVVAVKDVYDQTVVEADKVITQYA